MDIFLPLIIAFCGALFGSYFAILKGKNERLWKDRYELILSVVEISEEIKQYFLVKQSDNHTMNEYSIAEKEHIEKTWESSRLRLSVCSSRIRVTFKNLDSEKLVNSIQDLDRAIISALAESDVTQINHKLNVVWTHCESCIDEAIKLSRKRCI